MQYVASLSYGKDSIAMIHVIRDVLHQPLDRIITADVWATDTIPAELPPMVEFKEKADRIIKERWGIEVEHIFAKKKLRGGWTKATYQNTFYTEIADKQGKWAERRKKNNKRYHRKTQFPYIYGFPCVLGAWCNSKLKVSALNEARKAVISGSFLQSEKENKEELSRADRRVSLHDGSVVQQQTKNERNKVFYAHLESEVVQYIGIAADEGDRTERHKKKAEEGKERLPLVEAGWTEQMCRDWCEENDLLSPIYTSASRGGCWFCHNQGTDQLRMLRHDYPELWALLLKWDNDSPVTFKPDGKTVHDYDRRFQWEDEGYMPTGKTFRWKDTIEQQMNIFQFLGDDSDE